MYVFNVYTYVYTGTGIEFVISSYQLWHKVAAVKIGACGKWQQQRSDQQPLSL